MPIATTGSEIAHTDTTFERDAEMTPEIQFRFVMEKQEREREQTALRRLVPGRGPFQFRLPPVLRIRAPRRESDEATTPAFRKPAW
jgi:hypothetical protein